MLIHLLVEPVSAVTTTANADERKQVPHLLDGIEVKTGNEAGLRKNSEELPQTKDMILCWKLAREWEF